MNFKSSFNVGILSALTSIMLFALVFAGCKKESLKEDKDILSLKISSSEKFDLLYNSLSFIKKQSQIFSNPLIEYSDLEINQQLTSIKDGNSFNKFLNILGYSKPESFVNNILGLNFLIQDIFNQYPSLYQFDKAEITDIFIKAYYRKKYDLQSQIKSMDICSQDYADRISDCEEDLALGLFVAGVGGFIAGGGIGAPATILLGAGAAYYQESRCRARAVRDWKKCRTEHPLN